MTRKFVKVECDRLDIGELVYLTSLCFQFRFFPNKKVEKKNHKREKLLKFIYINSTYKLGLGGM